MPTISGFSKAIQSALIPGGPVGAFSVPGDLQPSDTLLSVLHIIDGSPATAVERKSEFTITAGKGNSVTNTTTVTTGGFLYVTWVRND